MRLCFNINEKNEPIINQFKSLLEGAKSLMEAEMSNFYLNIFYNTGDSDEIDLSKAATVELARNGLIIYSLNTKSSMVIPYMSIRSLELVEVKK